SLEQVKNLHKRFQQLSGNEDTIRSQDPNETGCLEEIDFEQFLMVMGHFRPPTLKTSEEERIALRTEKLRFLFNMHDTDNDGIITLEEYRKVVEELLSKSGSIGQEAAKAIADAAMLEVASTNVPHMILKGLEMESRMHIRFLDVDTTTMRCGKSTS
ncbi:Calcineurin B-like proteinous protein 3, partial [Nibea albiflora]